MIKRISTGLLKPGMFIHHLECGWMDRPFMRNRFPLISEAQTTRIREAGIPKV